MAGKNIGVKERTARAAADPEVVSKFRMVARRFAALREFRLSNLEAYEQLRQDLDRAREKVLANHPACIRKLAGRVEARGGVVHMAADGEEARRIISTIARDAGAGIVVKGKSMTSEEIGLTDALEKEGMEVFETDLGEYIIQLAGEKPSHIVTPAIHKNRHDIAALFADKLGMELTDDPAALALKAREVLRKKFLAADVGITGANALAADNGTLVLLENEGNIRLSTTVPRVHVALAGIEKILPSFADVPGLLRLLPTSATGQKLSCYVSMIRGPRRRDERDGPREFHLVLLDNGRSRMREDPVLREALKCIRCGACANVCPVYQHVGGHAYGSVYPGPIGAMITEALATGDEGWMLPFACSACGACTDVCPAKIPIHHVLAELRRRAVAGVAAGEKNAWPPQPSRAAISERAAFRVWSEMWSRPAGYRLSVRAAAIGSRFLVDDQSIKDLPPPGNGWTDTRDFPVPARRPFHQRWRSLDLPAPAIKAEPARPPAGDEAEAPRPPEGAPRPRPGNIDGLIAEMKIMKAETFAVAGPGQARERLQEVLAEFSGQGIVCWDHPDLDELGLAALAEKAGVEVLAADGRDEEGLIKAAAGAAAGITSSDYGLADSGTLALLTAPGRERSISLLPPVHVALLRQDRVLESIEDLPAALERDGHLDFRGITFVSGPSMTGDIEMIPVFGVHGPARLLVIVY